MELRRGKRTIRPKSMDKWDTRKMCRALEH